MAFHCIEKMPFYIIASSLHVLGSAVLALFHEQIGEMSATFRSIGRNKLAL